MTLSAILDGVRIDALALDGADARHVQGRSRTERSSLTHPGCGKPVQLRAGTARTWHFAHLPGACPDGAHEPEGWQHRAVKRAVLLAARAIGWSAQEEHRRVDGRWIADVLVSDGQDRLAIEVQWSQQGVHAYRSRTARYARDGIRTIWLHRSRTIPGLAAGELEHWRVGVRGTEAEHRCYVVDGIRARDVADFVHRLLQGRLTAEATAAQAEPEWNFVTMLAQARRGHDPGPAAPRTTD